MTSPSVASAPAPDVAAVAAVVADTWLRRFREILIAVLGGTVAGIGALAFYTSFEAIKQYANGSGGIDPRHDFAIPLLVDSFIVVATGADLWFATTRQQRRLWETWWPKALLAGAAGVSFALNVAHATSDKWTARGVAAIPPAALVLGVELLMMVLRRATALRVERLAALAVPATAAAPEQPPSVPLGRNTLTERYTPALPARKRNSTPRAGRNTPGGTSRPEQPGGTAGAEPPAAPQPDRYGRHRHGAEPPSRRAQAKAWVRAERAAGRHPTGTQVAQRFGISAGLGRRAIRDADTDGGLAAAPAHQPPPATEALRLVGARSTADPAPALPAAQGGEP
jgi:Protein of unknown function (DUF2637)